MTFLEAAIAVLRREGRPLHYREITKLAIERDLLSHIGKMPEQAMQTRLSAAARRRDPDAGLAKVGPGTYSLSLDPLAGPQAHEPPAEEARAPNELDRDSVEAPHAPPAGAALVEAPSAEPDEEVEAEPELYCADPPSLEPQPTEDDDHRASEGPLRARKRRRRRRRSKGAEAAGGLAASLAHLIEARGRPIKVSEIAAAARARGLIVADARRAEEVVLSILRTEASLEVSRGRRPRFAFDGDQVELLDRAMGAEALDLEQRLIAGAEQLAGLARARVAAALRTQPLAAVAAITRACLAADERPDPRLVTVVSDGEVRLECPPTSGGSALSVVVLACEGDATEQVDRYVAQARQAGRAQPSSLLVVTTGTRSAAPPDGGAREVEVWDAMELATRMERLGLGYRSTSVSLVFFDADFFVRLSP